MGNSTPRSIANGETVGGVVKNSDFEKCGQ